MITREELEELARLEGSDESPILSLYLHVDPSRAANVNRAFEVALRGMLSSIEHQLEGDAQRAEFEGDALRTLDFVARYTPHARSLILFCDASADFLWHRELEVPVADDAHWGRALQLRPLLETLGEYERYGVVLVDRRRARFFCVHLLEIEEHPALFTPEVVRRVRSTGTQQVWSQKHFQRRAESHAQDHLRQVAKFTERLFVERACDRLVLAGPHDVTTHLAGLLPKRLRGRIAGSAPLAVESPAKSVLEVTLGIAEDVERTAQQELVEELTTLAEKSGPAALGLEDVLDTVRDGRVWRLVYTNGLHHQGVECSGCGALFVTPREQCPICTRVLREIADVVGRAGERVFRQGGRVEEVHGDAALLLEDRGGIGALLRF